MHKNPVLSCKFLRTQTKPELKVNEKETHHLDLTSLTCIIRVLPVLERKNLHREQFSTTWYCNEDKPVSNVSERISSSRIAGSILKLILT